MKLLIDINTEFSSRNCKILSLRHTGFQLLKAEFIILGGIAKFQERTRLLKAKSPLLNAKF